MERSLPIEGSEGVDGRQRRRLYVSSSRRALPHSEQIVKQQKGA